MLLCILDEPLHRGSGCYWLGAQYEVTPMGEEMPLFIGGTPKGNDVICYWGLPHGKGCYCL